jgi:hypothetical protein
VSYNADLVYHSDRLLHVPIAVREMGLDLETDMAVELDKNAHKSYTRRWQKNIYIYKTLKGLKCGC